MTAAETPAGRTSLDTTAATLLVVLCLIWAFNQVGMKVANIGIQPVFQAAIRSICGAILVFGWCRIRRVPLFQSDATLRPGIFVGLLFGLEFVLIYVGLDFTNVSRATVFIYTAPFVVAIGAHFLFPGERLTPIRVVGLVCAFAGVVLAFSDELSLPSRDAALGDVLCLLGGIAWGSTTLVVKGTRLARASPEKVLLYQLVVSALPLLVLTAFFGPLVRDFSAIAAWAVAFQVIVVVFASYLTWFWLIRHYPVSRLAAFTFLAPVFAVAFGGFLLGETLTWKLLGALVLVAIGIALVNRPSA